MGPKKGGGGGAKDAKASSSKPKDVKEEKEDKKKLKPATAINVRHILCTKHSKKEEAIAALLSGAKFDDVARDFSEDKARQGGSLGWKVRGSLIKEFEDVAFGLEVSSTGKPVWGECRTGEGYHVCMVEGRR
ncbi:Peptidyl-prolyl cis-trans isomerase pin4 [Venturia effusa]|uniref:Peptidyl-prolyl cis-trans isomerase n=1 Tax=Venturia effusa TaxID=50376 RepID=A0A517LEE9_9PEZI|nr:Peptidyl-prolyl cis-trans isomerase pin4 [Venturia effusa]